MNKICDFCTHQRSNGKGGVECGQASYHMNDGYGPFKAGSNCVYDSDLRDEFQPRTGEEISIRNLSDTSNRLYDQNIELKNENQRLKGKLMRLL